MKKIMALLLMAVLVPGLLSGCGAKTAEEGAPGKLSIVATIFPQYDWTREILGERAQEAELTLLMGGVDLHSFQPTAEDIVKISTCDLFIYVGGESDRWVDDVLKTSANRNMTVISLMDALGSAVREEELTEGMEAEEEEEEEEGPEYDEHVWLSLKNAKTICMAIADALCALDPEGKDVYEKNAEDYIGRLDELDREFRETVEGAARDTLLFADRFPFRYMAEDYGLRYYAAFPGCSAETEASFETIVFLANKADELELPAVIRLESSDGSIARTVVENTKTKDLTVLTMDSMQSVTKQQAEDGVTYLSVMTEDLAVLRRALS